VEDPTKIFIEKNQKKTTHIYAASTQLLLWLRTISKHGVSCLMAMEDENIMYDTGYKDNNHGTGRKHLNGVL